MLWLLAYFMIFLNTDIKEVVLTISAAYESDLVDQNISSNRTVHLDSVGLIEGLSAIAIPIA
jgi:hypothetical protein